MRNLIKVLLFTIIVTIFNIMVVSSNIYALSDVYEDKIYNIGSLKPIDSRLNVKVGDVAPEFTLKSISGRNVTLSEFRDKKNVMLTFIPAAWTPVCSDQWPGYNIARQLFESYDTVILGISIDNLPTLFAWTQQMGALWFEVLSDFWPHGKVADSYGILRGDGVAERAIFLIDKKGVLQFIHVGNINVRPDLGMIVNEMQKMKK